MPQQLFPFLALVTVLTVTPGPDMALGLRNGVRGGARGTWWTGLGCCAGLVVHASAAILGLSALLAASATAYTVVKFAGAAYLIYLGVQALWNSRKAMGNSRKAMGHNAETAAEQATDEHPRTGLSRWVAFRQGLLSNILNPKIAVLFLSLLPQFVSPNEPRLTTSALLATVFLVVAVLWWRIYSLLVGTVGHLLTRQRVRTVLDRITGTVLVALGLRVALDSTT
ncbi:threonine/homoserine/homoserine lactone efflux protein [Tamaricihabitans halophyticus]|uniref:Threonine/homoserine/homoserine lactone efflux protein n=1 Tax=Tamaricihabitans halophyticus TaxID=1262583 RepID=A0A4R2QXC9_9PSEU|nr:LysE family translocator [Tamaricihabitans halophyticus]TCP54832.1 threonine/homoserine/homoserine lactone efflux protein [Tamaricihabitans halophyticus]